MARPPITSAREVLSPVQARRLYAYNLAVLDRYVRAARRLPWSVANRRREIGHQSIFGTLVHILNVHEVWLGYILQGRNRDADLEPLFTEAARKPKDWASFAPYYRRVRAAILGYLADVTARDLARPAKVFWMRGRFVASDGILQATLEQAHHLGEIIAVLWQRNTEPPEMTWIDVGAAARRGGP
ncbi:MAG TPA: DinB family protein [Thermoplasmata archaeon]|nr:DinB family protein [Thermoplasmata archaeon]